MYKSLLFCVLFLLSIGTLWAQDRQLSGTVRDEGGQGLPGVNVQIKGTTRGTTTDAEGAYRIGATGAGTMVFSSIGFGSKELPFTATTTELSAQLTADDRTLNEVVVTALGITKSAKTLTYATQQIEGAGRTACPGW